MTPPLIMYSKFVLPSWTVFSHILKLIGKCVNDKPCRLVTCVHTYVTWPAKIDHVSANYTKLYFH